jgi:hypothetical protein
MATFYWIGGFTGHTGSNSGYDSNENTWTNWMTGAKNIEGDYVYGPYAWDIKENWLELDEFETRLQIDEYDGSSISPTLSVRESTRFPGQNITGGNDIAIFGRFHGRMWRHRLDPVTGKPITSTPENWYWHDIGNNISCLFGGVQADGFTASGMTGTRAGQTSGISVFVERNWINGADILHPNIIGQQLSSDPSCGERQDHSWANPMRFIPTDVEGSLANFDASTDGCDKSEQFGVVDGKKYRSNNWTAIYGNHANMFRTGEIGLIRNKNYSIRPDSNNPYGATGATSNSTWLNKFGHVLRGIQLNLRCANFTSIDKPGRAAWPMAFESFPSFNDQSGGGGTIPGASSKMRYGKLGGVPYQRGYNSAGSPGRMIWAYGSNTIQNPNSFDQNSTPDLNGVFWKDGYKIPNNFVMEEFISINNVMNPDEFTYDQSIPYNQSSGFVKIIREDESESPSKFGSEANPNRGFPSAISEGPFSSTYRSENPVKYYTFSWPNNYDAWQRKYSGRHIQLSGSWGSSTEISSAKTELLNFSTENLKIENGRLHSVFIDSNSSMATIKIAKNRYMLSGVEIEGNNGSPYTLQSIEIDGGWENQSRKYDIGVPGTGSLLNFNKKPYWTEINNNIDNCVMIGKIYQSIGDNMMAVPTLIMKPDNTFAEEYGNPSRTWTEEKLWFKPGFNQSYTPNLVGSPIVRLGHVQIDNLQLLGGNLNVRTDKIQSPPPNSSAVDCVIRNGNIAGNGVAFMMGDVRRANDSATSSVGSKGGMLGGKQGVRQLIVGLSPGDNGIVFQPTSREFCNNDFLFIAPSNHTLRNAERYAYITNRGLTATGT